MLALSTPVAIAFGALSLFGALVVTRYAFALVRHLRSLARSVGRANEGLRTVTADVREEVARAQGTLERMRERRGDGRARRR